MSRSDLKLEEVYSNILSKKTLIDEKALLLSQENLFGEVSLKITEGTPTEYLFIRTISWLYALYYEAGKINVKFITEYFQVYNLELPDLRLNKHYELIPKLRAFFQHNLLSTEDHDSGIKEYCEQWFESLCGSLQPEDEVAWQHCLLVLLKDVHDFLETSIKCLQFIEKDESRGEIIKTWEFRRRNHHPPHEFHKLIQMVAIDLGRNFIDPKKFYQQHQAEWNKELKLKRLEKDYNFEKEVRKMIETALMRNPIPPIDGNDIMRYFALDPGPQVGKYREKAQNIYNSNPNLYSVPEKLLEKLKEEIDAGV
jgi:hypothetical protein